MVKSSSTLGQLTLLSNQSDSLTKELQVEDFRLLKNNIKIVDGFIGARKGQGTALTNSCITAFSTSPTSLLQGQKMERVKCGKTEQLSALPARNYQIAFLYCQQNKPTHNSRT